MRLRRYRPVGNRGGGGAAAVLKSAGFVSGPLQRARFSQSVRGRQFDEWPSARTRSTARGSPSRWRGVLPGLKSGEAVARHPPNEPGGRAVSSACSRMSRKGRLSQSNISNWQIRNAVYQHVMARPAGLEPATHSLEVVWFSVVFNGGWHNALDIVRWCRMAWSGFANYPWVSRLYNRRGMFAVS